MILRSLENVQFSRLLKNFCSNILQCVTENLMNTDQRNDLADKPRHQLFFAPPCSLRRCAMPRGLLRLRFGGADDFLRGEPPAVGPAIQVPFQFPQRGLVCLLRSAAFLSPACIRNASSSLQGPSPATVYIFFVTGMAPLPHFSRFSASA